MVLTDRKDITLILSVVFVATFVDGLDSSAVNIALPSIASSLSTDVPSASWATAVYLTTLAAFLVPFAKISSNGNVRAVMCSGLALFAGASVLSGVSQTYTQLIVFRILHGIGAAMIAAAGPVACTELLPRGYLATGLAVITGGSGAGFAIGPTFGGFVVDLAGWRWIFLFNVIPCTLGIIAAMMSMPRGRGGIRLDVPGSILIGVATASAIVFLETLPDGGTVPITSAILTLASLVLFVIIEKKTADPLLNPGIFRSKGFAGVFVSLFLVNAISLGELYLLPFYCGICMDLGASEIGLALVVTSIIVAVFSVPVARWSDRVGRRREFCVAGGALFAISMAMLIPFVEDMPMWVLVVSMAVKGVGWCFAGGPMSSNLVEHAGGDRDMASSLTNEALYIGGAVGTASMAALLALTSSAKGMDIASVSPGTMAEGFLPCIIVLTAMSIIVMCLSAIIWDIASDDDRFFVI